MNAGIKPAVAELIGTFGLIFMGAGSIIATRGQDLTAIAFAHGLAIGLGVLALGKVSGGHFNPAVTIAFLITGRIGAGAAATYVVSQLIGAVLAGFALVYFLPPEAVGAAGLGNPELAKGVQFFNGLLVELVLTFFLVTVIFGTAVDPRGPNLIAGLAIGLTITMDILAAGPITGAAMNPARSFGTAVPGVALGMAGDFFANHLVYWIGPILGGALAALLYDVLFMEKDARIPG
ncbi:MAG: aquaporin [Chloroflexi bacterium]|nr:aquaporin [Chloroflexota bacterium]